MQKIISILNSPEFIDDYIDFEAGLNIYHKMKPQNSPKAVFMHLWNFVYRNQQYSDLVKTVSPEEFAQHLVSRGFVLENWGENIWTCTRDGIVFHYNQYGTGQNCVTIVDKQQTYLFKFRLNLFDADIIISYYRETPEAFSKAVLVAQLKYKQRTAKEALEKKNNAH